LGYASAILQQAVPEALCFHVVRPCVRFHDSLSRLCYALKSFHQTFVNNAAWDKYELIRFSDQKTKCQGHTMTKYAKIPFSGFVSATYPLCMTGFLQIFVASVSWGTDELLGFGVKGQISRLSGGSRHRDRRCADHSSVCDNVITVLS